MALAPSADCADSFMAIVPSTDGAATFGWDSLGLKPAALKHCGTSVRAYVTPGQTVFWDWFRLHNEYLCIDTECWRWLSTNMPKLTQYLQEAQIPASEMHYKSQDLPQHLPPHCLETGAFLCFLMYVPRCKPLPPATKQKALLVLLEMIKKASSMQLIAVDRIETKFRSQGRVEHDLTLFLLQMASFMDCTKWQAYTLKHWQSGQSYKHIAFVAATLHPQSSWLPLLMCSFLLFGLAATLKHMICGLTFASTCFHQLCFCARNL